MASFVIDVVAPAKGCTVTLASNPLRTMNFDVIEVSFGPETRVTEHPVELGFEVSDHVQLLADRFTVEAFVTGSPLATNPLAPRPSSAISFLNSVLGQLLDVDLGGEGRFANYVLEGFSHRRTSQEGRGFSLRFKQIRIASALSVKIPPGVPASVAAAGAPTEQALGEQATTAGTPVSALKDIKDTTSSLSPIALISSLLGF